MESEQEASSPRSAFAPARAPRDATNAPDTLLAFARELVGLTAAIGSLSLVMRALVVSHFDLTVTGALTANVSATTFVTSTLVQVTPLALYGGAMAAMYHNARRPRPYLIALAAALTCPLVGTSEVVASLLLLAGLPAAFLVGRIQSRRNLLVRLAGWVGIGVLLINFLPVRMWLPTERADISGVPQTIYVLREAGGDLVVFDPQSVSVLRVPMEQISNRQFCQSGDRFTIGEHLLGRAERQVPPCP